MKATCVDGDYIKWCNMIGHIYMGMYSRCLYCVKTHVQLNASNRNGNKFSTSVQCAQKFGSQSTILCIQIGMLGKILSLNLVPPTVVGRNHL